MPIKGCGVKGACQKERGDKHHRHIVEVPHDRGSKIAFHGVFQQDIQKPGGEKRGDNLQVASNFNIRAAQMHGEPPGDAARARQDHQSRRARRAASRQTEEADFRLRSQLDGGEHGPKDEGEDGPCRHNPPLERVCSACTAHPSSLSSSHDPLFPVFYPEHPIKRWPRGQSSHVFLAAWLGSASPRAGYRQKPMYNGRYTRSCSIFICFGCKTYWVPIFLSNLLLNRSSDVVPYCLGDFTSTGEILGLFAAFE